LLFGSRCRRCPNRWIDRFWFQPDHAAAVHTAISELQSLQSGRRASIATRPPYDNLKPLSVYRQLRIPSFRYKISTTEREERGTLSLSDTR
jgi:hypothetical protein